MRRFRLTLAVAAAVAMFSATAAGASSGSAEPGGVTAQASASLSGKQKQAKRKALRSCGKKSSPSRRQACRKKVAKRFERKSRPSKPNLPAGPAQPTDPAVTIEVGDDFFAPDIVNIESGDTVLWLWNDMNHDPHNLTLVSGPDGVDRNKFETSSSPAVDFSFWRAFTVPGTYEFACSLHTDMKLTVVVT